MANISLYDNAGGGAGFASSANIYMDKLLRDALTILDCPSDCDGCCQDCLLGYDTRFHSNVLVRQIASVFIEKLVNHIDAGKPESVLSHDEEICYRTLEHELMSLPEQGTCSISIIVSGDYDNWDLASGKLKTLALGLKQRYKTVAIMIASKSIIGINEDDLEDLRALSRLEIELHLSEDKQLSESKVLAQVDSGYAVYTFAANEAYLIPDEKYQQYAGILVKSLSIEKLASKPVELKMRSVDADDTYCELEILSEVNGRLNQFGHQFWNRVKSKSPAIKKLFDDTSVVVSSVTYTDPYISTPIAALFFHQFILELTKQLPSISECGVTLFTRDLSRQVSRRPCGIFSEWVDNETLEKTLVGIFQAKNLELAIVLNKLSALPHGRCLTINLSNGEVYTIRLDHGFGCWGPRDAKPAWFDIEASVDQQVKDLLDKYKGMTILYKKKYKTQIFVKKMSN